MNFAGICERASSAGSKQEHPTGSSRSSRPDFARFIEIATGSLFEDGAALYGGVNAAQCWRPELPTRGSCMSDMKSSPLENIDQYIAGFPAEVQERLQQIRAIVREAAPGAEERIKYRMPTFELLGNLVHFAAFQRHIGFYPTPSAIAAFKKELASYKSGRGSVQFPLNQPLPLSLIRRMVNFRVKEARQILFKRKRSK